jgi:dienelactone hydrolase
MFTIPRSTQSEIVLDRNRRTREYLSHIADVAEMAREADWEMPTNPESDEFKAFQQRMRERLAEMIDYPPPGDPIDIEPEITSLGGDEDGEFFRVQMPLLEEGFGVDGILIRPRGEADDEPLAVAIHGGGGTPELAAGILESGSGNYNDMGRRLVRSGHVVWMPACHEGNGNFIEENEAPCASPHTELDFRARLVQSTLSALDTYGIIQSTEIMMMLHGRRDAVAVGLSYGGFRSLMVTALSPLFCACISSCYFNDRRPLLEAWSVAGQFSDWFFRDTLGVATDVEVCKLIAPRPLYVEVGKSDELFPADGAERAAKKVAQVYERLDCAESFQFEVFDGGHEFSGVKSLDWLRRLRM